MVTSHRTDFKVITPNFVILVFSSVLFYSSLYIILNYLPAHVLSLGGSEADIGLVTGIFVAGSLVIRPLVGWLIDHLGRKPVMVAGNLVFTVAPLLYSVPSSVAGLMMVRLFHGLGLSIFTTAGLTIVTDLVDDSRWGEATGYFLSAQLVAISLAPAIGSALAGEYGLIKLVPFASVIAFLSLMAAGSVKSPHGLSVSVIPSGYIQKISKNLGLRSAILAAIAVGLGYSTVITFLPLISKQLGLNGASLFYFIYASVALLVRAPAGRVSDKIGRKTLIIPTVALTVLALLMISTVKTPLGMGFAAVLYGLGFGSAYPVIGALAVDNSPIDTRGAAVGLYGGGFDIGLLLGSVLGGMVGVLFGGSAIFIVVAGLISLGLLLFHWSGSHPSEIKNGETEFE